MLNARHFAMLTLIFAAAATRLIPHPPNFTAVGAISLFAGVYFTRRYAAIAIPLVALFVSDAMLSLMWFGGSRWSFAPVFTYVLFAATAMLGMAIRTRPNFVRITLASLAASVVFFMLSNWYVWFSRTEKLYPLTPEGLLACYIAALPFAQNMILGNLFYSGVLFGGWQVLQRFLPELQTQPSEPIVEGQ